MVTAFLCWVFQLFVILPYGLSLLAWKRRPEDVETTGLEYSTLAFFIGIVVLTTLTSVFTFFMKISWQALLLITILAALQWIWLIRQKRLPVLSLNFRSANLFQCGSLLLLAAAMVITLVAVTFTPNNSDTGLYHAQAIHWIEEFKAVPGLTLLHSRFGYNSSWLVINALFSFSFLNLQSFHILPSLLYIVAIFYFYTGLYNLVGGSQRFSDLTRSAFFVACLLFLTGEISSLGTDLPVILITWFICSELVRMIESKSLKHNPRMFWLSLILIFSITIKLTAAPLLLIVLWWLIQALRERQGKVVLVTIASTLLIILPFVGRNIILSGHLFYPGLNLDPIHLEWSIPQDKVNKEKEVIHWFALLPRVSREKFMQMTWQEQYKRWFFDQVPRHKAMLVFLATALPAWLILLVSRRWRRWISTNREILPVVLTLVVGVFYWLIAAPAIRFGYGFLLALITLLGVPLILFIIDAWKSLSRVFIPIVLVITVLIGANTLYKTLTTPIKASQLLIPLDYPSLPTEMCKFGNFSIECATEWESCWYKPFPCAIRSNPDIYMRGDSFSDGFSLSPE